MMPVYMDMNTHPHQMSPHGFYPPGYGNGPHQVRLDSPMPVSYWPNSGGHGFPMPCYGCCVHGNLQSCNSFRPFYPPQAVHDPCCTSYSGFHPAHHAHSYYIPPRCPVDHQPRFEYDKDVARNSYCSGCPNHACAWRNGNSVRIEEQEPETAKENRTKAVVPAQPTGFPYPIIWVPHESVNQEHTRPGGSEKQAPAQTKAPEVTKAPERNGWFPLDSDALRSLLQNQDGKGMEKGQKVVFPYDVNKLKSLLQGGDGEGVQNQGRLQGPVGEGVQNQGRLQGPVGEEVQNQRSGAESGQFPYPIFWIPSQGKFPEDKRSGDTGAAQRHTEKGFPVLKFFPFNLQEIGDQSAKHEGKEGNFEHSVGSDTKEKQSQQQSAPVKQSEDRAPSSMKEELNTRQKTIPMKQSEDQGQKTTDQAKRVTENKPHESTMKKQSSSPPKASKLPPVCLRIDPLPKKKNGNGSSRSPSPPTRKGESSAKKEDSAMPPASPRSEKEDPEKSGTRTIPVAREVQCEEASKRTHSNVTGSEEERNESEVNPEKEVEKVQSTPDEELGRGDEAAKLNETTENIQKSVKKTSSDNEAATVIQSGYRGYEVRRWEPLKKLKQMANIREQMLDIQNRIQAIEGSTDHRNNEKEITVAGEMVMSLLLRLDAIQGLHSSVRDIRKSLAKELLSLQEKLDSLKSSKATMEDVSIVKQVESPGEAVEVKTYSETPGEAVEIKIYSETGEDRAVPRKGRLAIKQEMVSEPVKEESVVPFQSSAEPITIIKDETGEQLSASKQEEPQLVQISVRSQEEMTTPTTDMRDELSRCNSDAAKAVISEELKEDEAAGETVPWVNSLSADGKETTLTSGEKADVAEESLELMTELPQHVEGDEQPTPEGDENKDAEMVENMLENTKGMTPSENDAELLELPIGVIDEERQDSPHPELHISSSPCPLQASVNTSEPVIELSDALNTKVDQPHEGGESNNTNEDLTVKERDDSIKVGYLQETPEDIAKPKAPCEEANAGDCLELESVEHNEHEGEKSQSGRAEQNANADAEIAETRVEAEEETSGRDKKLMEENQRLREAMEKLMEAGREQLEVISSLNGRVKSLEKKLSRKTKTQAARRRRPFHGRTKSPTAAAAM